MILTDTFLCKNMRNPLRCFCSLPYRHYPDAERFIFGVTPNIFSHCVGTQVANIYLSIYPVGDTKLLWHATCWCCFVVYFQCATIALEWSLCACLHARLARYKIEWVVNYLHHRISSSQGGLSRGLSCAYLLHPLQSEWMLLKCLSLHGSWTFSPFLLLLLRVPSTWLWCPEP